MKQFLRTALIFLIVVYITPIGVRAKSEQKLAALTFDDGPHAVYTAQLLDGLKERAVKATFFMLGQCAQAQPELVRRAYEEGHEVACHTWSHPDLKKLSDEKIKEQISRCSDLFNDILGEGNSYLVRPPYGSTDKRVRAAVDQVMLFWSVDTLDWKLKDEERVYQKIITEIRDGAVILCHDIHRTTIPAVLRAVDTLRAEGYEFVTVSELFRRRGVEPQSGKLYSECAPGAADPGPMPMPVISFEAAEEGQATVTIDSDAPVYFTTDGSCPDGRSKRYTGPFSVCDGTEVRAVAAWKLNGSRSAICTARWERPLARSDARDHSSLPSDRDRRAPECFGRNRLVPVFAVLIPLAWRDTCRREAAARRRPRPRFDWDV